MAGPTSTGQGGQAPPMPKMTGMLITLMLMLVLMMFYQQVGSAMNAVLKFIDFGYQHPVVTLILAGLLMTTLSTVIRAATTDMVKQQRNQKESSAFNKELRTARIENNLYKIKKLTDMQQQMMSKNMEGMSSMMKTMPLTMLVVIPIFAWVRYYIQHAVDNFPNVLYINVPWAQNVYLNGSMVLPTWVFVYILVSIPIGQLVNRLIRTYLFRKRLKELETQGVVEVL